MKKIYQLKSSSRHNNYQESYVDVHTYRPGGLRAHNWPIYVYFSGQNCIISVIKIHIFHDFIHFFHFCTSKKSIFTNHGLNSKNDPFWIFPLIWPDRAR